MSTLSLLLLLIPLHLFGQTMVNDIKEPAGERISEQFVDGRFLIYDCSKGFFSCVDRQSFAMCKELREAAINRKYPNLSCAPLREFNEKPKCYKKLHELMEGKNDKSYCFKP